MTCFALETTFLTQNFKIPKLDSAQRNQAIGMLAAGMTPTSQKKFLYRYFFVYVDKNWCAQRQMVFLC